MKRIVRRKPQTLPDVLPAHLNPVLKRVYLGRGVTSPRELETGFDHLHPFALLRGIDAAVALLADALDRQERILIVADFDADGATSCATMVRGLRLLGAKHVGFLVPNRFEYGYGLTPQIVQVAAQHEPDLIITVDNGISSIDGVAQAHQLGIKVLVTDHHLPGAVLPAADAIVNPNQPGDEFPSKNLAGVGVVFYVLLALRAHLRQHGWFARSGVGEPNLAQLLDLVALGTVADVVPLDHCNRILVAQGLARINRGRCSPGLQALFQVAGRDPERVVAADLGFAVGPRLNAAGRLNDMTLGINCLLAEQLPEAIAMARQLDGLNRERRDIEERMKAQAFEYIGDLLRETGSAPPAGLCLFDESWHQGVIGIVAARVKERLHRPVVALARSNEQELKGSARSVPGLHIRDTLDRIATRTPGLLSKFGGHAMAAGLTLPADRLAEFRDAFEQAVAEQLGPEDLQALVYSDGELPGEELNLDFAQLLREAGPWGQGFPEPVFDGVFGIADRRIVGERHLRLSLRGENSDRTVEAIAFNTDERQVPVSAQRVEVAYKLDVNEYRGQRTPQLLVEYVRPW